MMNPESVVTDARNAFNSGVTKSFEFRLNQIKALLRLIEENEEKIISAIIEDTRKPIFEAKIFEVEFLKNTLKNIIYNLKEWMEPIKPSKPLPFLIDTVSKSTAFIFLTIFFPKMFY